MAIFSTKSETLEQLQNIVTSCKVLPQVRFTVSEYKKNKDSSITKILDKFHGDSVIIRSSALSEDTTESSKAGQYLSIGNVQGKELLEKSINDVIEAFDDDNSGNQIFVQPMLTKVEICGVLFTIDPNNGGNYYVLNYDDTTGLTDTVTSGGGQNLKTMYVFRESTCEDLRIQLVLNMAQELEKIFNNSCLDIEFAIVNNVVYLLQVRPLILKQEIANCTEQKKLLDGIHTYVEDAMTSKLYLYGKRTIYTVMTDWNPAEMIGLRPKPLAMSLYKRLITDRTWAYQRNNYGYKNLRSFPIMVNFCGLTYIDTRVSFSSFLPKELSENLSTKLVDFYLDKLGKNPSKQDKVEFEIVISCYAFDINDKLKDLLDNGFTQEECDEFKTVILKLTNGIIHLKTGLWIKDMEKIEILKQRRENILNSNLKITDKIYWLLEDCARYGTLPFAGLARTGFVAVILLKSLVNLGIISEQEYDDFMAGLNTISSTISIDKEVLSEKAFLKKYGHLRPGTYDIMSERYDEAPENYFSHTSKTSAPSEKNKFKLSIDQYTKIQELMNEHGFNGTVLELFEFIKLGIEGREYSKFIFTKSVSNVLDLFKQLGDEYNISREDMSYLNCESLNNLYGSIYEVDEVLHQSIQEGKRNHKKALQLSLPPVITSPEQIYQFYVMDTVANFITLKSTQGKVVYDNLTIDTIQDKILLITAADPGYDWIFSANIKGFVTAFGGSNSHMAIRAGELGIPAVIGVGESKLQELKNASYLKIDCANKRFEVIE